MAPFGTRVPSASTVLGPRYGETPNWSTAPACTARTRHSHMATGSQRCHMAKMLNRPPDAATFSKVIGSLGSGTRT